MRAFGLEQGTYKTYNDYSNHGNDGELYNDIENLYLYGNIQKENEFDRVKIDNRLYSILKTHDNIIMTIETVLMNGHIYASKLYWWHDSEKIPHGLICDIKDKKANKYALYHMANKAPHLNYNKKKE